MNHSPYRMTLSYSSVQRCPLQCLSHFTANPPATIGQDSSPTAGAELKAAERP